LETVKVKAFEELAVEVSVKTAFRVKSTCKEQEIAERIETVEVQLGVLGKLMLEGGVT